MPQNNTIVFIKAYLQALEDGEAGESLGRFFTEDAIQIELPNKLNPAGGQSDLAAMKKRSEEGKKILTQQRYTVKSIVADGDNVAVEAEWVGVLAIPLGNLPPGYEMKAHFAMFFTFEDGRIAVQRNYDCFEPW